MREPMDWSRVAAAMDHRMRELGYTVQDVADRSGLSVTIVKAALGNKKKGYRDGTLYDLSRALGWLPESLHRVGMGGSPITTEDLMTPERFKVAEGVGTASGSSTTQGAGAMQVAFSAPAEIIEALRANIEKMDRLERMVAELLATSRPNPTEPPPGTVPARTDAQRAADQQREAAP